MKVAARVAAAAVNTSIRSGEEEGYPLQGKVKRCSRRASSVQLSVVHSTVPLRVGSGVATRNPSSSIQVQQW